MRVGGGTITVKYGEEDEYEITAQVEAYDSGQTYGPPENCYPPEGGEVTISQVKLRGEIINPDTFVESLDPLAMAGLDEYIFEQHMKSRCEY